MVDGKKLILLVEDEPALAQTQALTLEAYGFAVLASTSGEEALETVRRRAEIDLVLMDINLGPGMDGTRAAERILAERELPLIFVSSHTAREIVAKTEGITSYGYIVKNSGETVFIASIKMAFRLHESRRKESESSARYRALVETLHDVVFSLDPAGKLTYLSPALSRIAGLRPEDHLGHDLAELLDPGCAAAWASQWARALEAGESAGEFFLTAADGTVKWLRIALQRVEEGRSLSGFRGVMSDITASRQIEHLLQVSHDLAVELNSCADLKLGLEAVLRAVVQLEAVDACGIYLADAESNSISMAVHRGLSPAFAARVSHFDAHAPTARLVLSGRPWYGNYGNLLTEDDEVRAREGLRALAVIPVMSQGKLIAALYLASRRFDAFPPGIRHAVETISFQVGGALLRLRTSDALRETEAIFSQFLEHSPIYVFFKDENARPIRLSRNYEGLLGRPFAEILGKSMEELFPGELSKSMVADDLRVIREGNLISVDEAFADRSYTTLKFPIDLPGKPRFLAGFTMDVTRSRRAEEALEAAVREKTLLLQEVHHRIKNNIASIESFLVLQARTSRNPEALSSLQDAIARVRSMRVLYESLLLSEGHSSVSSRAYFSGLLETVTSLFPNRDRVVVTGEIADFTIQSKNLVPAGIIVNELITNAMKYAFIGRDSGSLRLAVSLDGERVHLRVEDDGVGLPADDGGERRKGFGHRLVDMLVKQIGGTFEIHSGAGTRCELTFTL